MSGEVVEEGCVSLKTVRVKRKESQHSPGHLEVSPSAGSHSLWTKHSNLDYMCALWAVFGYILVHGWGRPSNAGRMMKGRGGGGCRNPSLAAMCSAPVIRP